MTEAAGVAPTATLAVRASAVRREAFAPNLAAFVGAGPHPSRAVPGAFRRLTASAVRGQVGRSGSTRSVRMVFRSQLIRTHSTCSTAPLVSRQTGRYSASTTSSRITVRSGTTRLG